MKKSNFALLREKSPEMRQVIDHLMEISDEERKMLEEEHRQRSERILKYKREYERDEVRKRIKEEGRKGNMEQVALKLLKEKANMDLISRVTGVTEERILKLKQDLLKKKPLT